MFRYLAIFLFFAVPCLEFHFPLLVRPRLNSRKSVVDSIRHALSHSHACSNFHLLPRHVLYQSSADEACKTQLHDWCGSWNIGVVVNAPSINRASGNMNANSLLCAGVTWRVFISPASLWVWRCTVSPIVPWVEQCLSQASSNVLWVHNGLQT